MTEPLTKEEAAKIRAKVDEWRKGNLTHHYLDDAIRLLDYERGESEARLRKVALKVAAKAACTAYEDDRKPVDIAAIVDRAIAEDQP